MRMHAMHICKHVTDVYARSHGSDRRTLGRRRQSWNREEDVSSSWQFLRVACCQGSTYSRTKIIHAVHFL